MNLLYKWDEAKNAKLVSERGVSFEEAVLCVEEGRVLVVKIRDCVYLVPYIDEGTEFILKTIIPSRKWTKKHLEIGD